MVQNRTILVVDDEETVRRVMCRWLSDENYACEEAENGEKALELLKTGLFSMVILDIMMPGLSGLQVLEKIREQHKNLAVIMVTGVDDRRTAQQAISLGAYGYIIKPYERNEVLINIASAFRRQTLEQDNKRYNEDLEMLVVERIREVKRHKEEIENALNEISSLMTKIITDQNFEVRFANQTLGKCSTIMRCGKKECICYDKDGIRCWQVAGTFCGGEVQGVFAEKYHKCAECPVFKAATPSYKMKIGEHFNNMMHILEAKHHNLQDSFEKLEKSQNRIIQQEKLATIGQLSAGIAHEINNPVGFISSNLGTLSKYLDKIIEFSNAQAEVIKASGANPEIDALRKKLKINYLLEDIPDLINESVDGCERIKTITRDLKSFSRTENDKPAAADINETIEKTISVVWNELKYKAKLIKEFGDLPPVTCYPQRLSQVFMNLLVNAAHAIKDQGVITIKTWQEDSFVHVTIADTGSGIAKENLTKIFEAFFTTKEEGKGTGLGLSICHEIIKKHQGVITVDSEVGKGTTFHLQIPEKPGFQGNPTQEPTS